MYIYIHIKKIYKIVDCFVFFFFFRGMQAGRGSIVKDTHHERHRLNHNLQPSSRSSLDPVLPTEPVGCTCMHAHTHTHKRKRADSTACAARRDLCTLQVELPGEGAT